MHHDTKNRGIYAIFEHIFFIFRIRVQMILSFLLHYSKSNLEAIWRNEKGLKMLHFLKNKHIFDLILACIILLIFNISVTLSMHKWLKIQWKTLFFHHFSSFLALIMHVKKHLFSRYLRWFWYWFWVEFEVIFMKFLFVSSMLKMKVSFSACNEALKIDCFLVKNRQFWTFSALIIVFWL